MKFIIHMIVWTLGYFMACQFEDKDIAINIGMSVAYLWGVIQDDIEKFLDNKRKSKR